MDATAKNMHDTAVYAEDTPAHAPGLLVSGHFKESLPYHVIRRHGTRDWLVTFTLRGCGRYRQHGVEFLARPGDLVLLEPDAFHDYGCINNTGWDFVWAHFIARPSWLPYLNWPAEGKGLARVSIADQATRRRMRIAFMRCISDSRPRIGGISEELALNALEEVIILAARESVFSRQEQAISPDVRRVIDFLSENLAQRHTIPALAKMARLSPSRLAHRFKEETGDAPIAYLLKLRLRHAARLLEFSGRRVKEVATDVGFESAFYFSRQFRKHFRMSPRQFQEKVAEKKTAPGS